MAGIRATITIDEELYNELIDMSKVQERSFSNQVVYLVKKGKERTEAQADKRMDDLNGRCSN